jgi:phosphoribosyl 1,2-cyclic phosphodiesterase
VPGHLDFMTLQAKRELLDCRRLIVTHMSQQMLERVDDLEVEAAYDGLAIDLG